MADTTTKPGIHWIWYVLGAAALIGFGSFFIIRRRNANLANAAAAAAQAAANTAGGGNTAANYDAPPNPAQTGTAALLSLPPVTGAPATVLPGGAVVVNSTAGQVVVGNTPAGTVGTPTPAVLTQGGAVVVNTSAVQFSGTVGSGITQPPGLPTGTVAVATHTVSPVVVAGASGLNSKPVNKGAISSTGAIAVNAATLGGLPKSVNTGAVSSTGASSIAP